jgi:hypothetical protein
MTDPKIPAPEPCAWADDLVVAGRIGAVESAVTKAHWLRGSYGTHAMRAAADRLTHPLITLAAAETYAAAREAAARQEERNRCIAEVGALHMAQTVNNQNHPRAWHDAVDAALDAIRAG